MENIKLEIKRFLLGYIQHDDLSADDDIFAGGYVNSLFAMQLILFVESEFGISVGSEDLEINNFRSINAIADLVERKRT